MDFKELTEKELALYESKNKDYVILDFVMV